MREKLRKISFCFRITADLSSFVKLILNSRKLRKSKSNPGLKDQSETAAYNLQFGNSVLTIALRTYAGDIDIFYEIFFRKVYALPAVSITYPKLIVDLGANIGLSALYFHIIYPEAKIICVEPDKYNYALLRSNLASLINLKQVSIVEAAVAAKDGELYFNTVEYAFNSYVTHTAEASATTYKVSAITLPHLFEQFAISSADLVKVDIEGGEKYILGSDASWLNKTKNLIIEIHSAEDKAVSMAAFKQYNFQVALMSGYNEAFPELFHASKT